jgi:hypothetical protein
MATTSAEARAIAKEAYIYGFPMVDNYRIQYAYFVDRKSPEYKAPWNELRSVPRVYTPEDKAIQTPNSDTPYSLLGVDLRAEPLVLTMPIVEKNRYFAAQLIDLYTHNFAYIGSRTTGNDGGSFMLAGPRWQGQQPTGIKSVIRCETDLAFVGYRTQLFDPADLENVKKIQAGYKVETLSNFLRVPAPAAPPEIDFMKPLTADEQRTSLEFFNILSFVLRFCPTHSSEQALMTRFAKLGIGAGKRFDVKALSPELRKAVEDGVKDAWQAYGELKKRVDAKEVTSGDLLGTREFLKNNYLYRMAAAILGIYGNSKQEAMYPMFTVDADGKPLDGSKGRYALRFASDELPPVNAFWSLTMYELPSSLLVANPLKRYLINSPMLPNLEHDADGGLTLYVQHESPGKDKEANWLPAPNGPFWAILRLYWPKAEALEGQWLAPPMEKAN